MTTARTHLVMALAFVAFVALITLTGCGGGGDDVDSVGPPCDTDCHNTYVPAPVTNHQCTSASCA